MRGAAASARVLCAVVAVAGAAVCQAAPTVQLQGSLGTGKALLVIDGVPQTLAVGASARGVTLRRLMDGEAEVEVAGQVQRLRLGAAPARFSGAEGGAGASGSSIVLAAGPGGHHMATGQINGAPVRFMVDTGATMITLSQSEATRIGVDWQRGQRGMTQTANGPVAVWQVTLSAVRIGDVEVANVAAVVVPAEMPIALLGNSFLNRFSMRRDADVLRLERKP
jgi:aspartyl protease family protein